MSLPLCLHRDRLTPKDRRALFADRILQFRPGGAREPERGGANRVPKTRSRYGAITDAAREWLSRRRWPVSFTEFCAERRLNADSMRACVWKLQHERRKAS